MVVSKVQLHGWSVVWSCRNAAFVFVNTLARYPDQFYFVVVSWEKDSALV
jgi:hypothetical protein